MCDPPRRPRVSSSVKWAVVPASGVALFVTWLLADIIFVKFPHHRETLRDWSIAVWCVALALSIAAHLWCFRRNIGHVLLATTGAALIAVLLICTAGIWFHFWIGGSL